MQKAIEVELAKIPKAAQFWATGTLDRAPEVSVAGLGPLNFPLAPDRLQRLVKLAQQAPYGRGSETIIDLETRNTRQISPPAVQVAGLDLDRILRKIKRSMGVSQREVRAQLYKLLIYQPGGLFKVHRDTEKVHGMFGTLVVSLPSPFSGGTLFIRHQDKTKYCQLGNQNWVAFYSDCEHEVQPVHLGARLVLVYNLVASGPVELLTRHPVTDARTALDQWAKQPEPPHRIAYLLEHHYTDAGLSWESLKGADQATGQILRSAASEADCWVGLGILSVVESGSAEHIGYSRRGRRSRDDEFVPEEVISRELIVVGWNAVNAPSQEGISLEEEEVIPNEAFQKLKPDKTYFTEATGNEGASYSRTYRRAVVLIVPKSRRWDLMASGSLSKAIQALDAMVVDAAQHADAQKLAAKLVERREVYRHEAQFHSLLWALFRLGDRDLLHGLFAHLSKYDFVWLEPEALVLWAAEAGPTQAREILRFEYMTLGAQDKLANIIILWTRAQRGVTAPQARQLGQELALFVLEKDKGPRAMQSLFPWLDQLDRPVTEAVRARLRELPMNEHVALCLAMLRAEPVERRREPRCTAIYRDCLSRLSVYDPGPLVPKDASRPSETGCDCIDCATLTDFLKSPNLMSVRFAMVKERRQHLFMIIGRKRLDVRPMEDRSTRPISLLLQKTSESFVQKQREVRELLGSTPDLLSLEGSDDALTPLKASATEKVAELKRKLP